MKKKDGIAQPTKASLEQRRTCGTCLHFKQSKHRSYDDVCSKLGVRQFAVAPKCWTPDYTKVITNTDEFVQLATLIAEKTPQQRQILLGIIQQRPMGRKLKMGTKVYINYRGREYISNYLSGYVVGYTSGNEIAICGSPDRNGRGRSFFAYLQDDESLLTPKEWSAKFLELRAKGRIQDPKVETKRDITAKVHEDNYEPPTIDNAPKDPTIKVKKKRLSHTSVVEILSF